MEKYHGPRKREEDTDGKDAMRYPTKTRMTVSIIGPITRAELENQRHTYQDEINAAGSLLREIQAIPLVR